MDCIRIYYITSIHTRSYEQNNTTGLGIWNEQLPAGIGKVGGEWYASASNLVSISSSSSIVSKVIWNCFLVTVTKWLGATAENGVKNEVLMIDGHIAVLGMTMEFVEGKTRILAMVAAAYA